MASHRVGRGGQGIVWTCGGGRAWLGEWGQHTHTVVHACCSCLAPLNCHFLISHPAAPPSLCPLPQKAHPGEVHAEATVARMLLGEAMLAALQRRRRVGTPAAAQRCPALPCPAAGSCACCPLQGSGKHMMCVAALSTASRAVLHSWASLLCLGRYLLYCRAPHQMGGGRSE